VAGHLSSFIGQQLIPLPANNCQELIDVHAGINSYLPAKVVVEILLLDAFGGMVAQKLCQTLDSHGSKLCLGAETAGAAAAVARNLNRIQNDSAALMHFSLLGVRHQKEEECRFMKHPPEVFSEPAAQAQTVDNREPDHVISHPGIQSISRLSQAQKVPCLLLKQRRLFSACQRLTDLLNSAAVSQSDSCVMQAQEDVRREKGCNVNT
jgi:hypothetical protein